VRFDHLSLEQFKPFEAAAVDFEPGVTVIHGLNGSGKSSLLEAAFFALYGARALDGTLDEVVTVGADGSTVGLSFTHDGTTGRIDREVRVRDGSARTARCVLETDGETIEGATDVREYVTGLLRMDAEAFRNCAYVRQGEVNALINAAPSERQDILDDLLQLGRLEEYRERASDARVGVGRVRDDVAGALSEVDSQIEAVDETELLERRDAIREQLSGLADDRERYEQNREQARQTLEEAQSVLEEQTERRAELAEVRSELEELRDRIADTAQKRERLADEIEDCRDRLERLRERRAKLTAELDVPSDELDEEWATERADEIEVEIEGLTEEIRELSVERQAVDSEREELETRAEELEETATRKREGAAELAADCEEAAAELEERRERLEELETEREKLRATFEDAPATAETAPEYETERREQLAEIRETIAEREAELKTATEALEDARELEAAGRCPECGQPVEGSPHVEAIDERRARVEELEADLEELRETETQRAADLDRAGELVDTAERLDELEAQRDTIEQIIEERAEALEAQRDRISRLREEAETRAEEAASKRATAADRADRVEELEARIEDRREEKVDRSDRLERVQSLADRLAEIADVEAEAETLREERAEKAEINDERRDRLERLRERREELTAVVDEERIESAESERDRAEQYLEEVEKTLAELAERQQTLQGQLGAIEQELDSLEQLRERKETLEARRDRLGSLYDQVESLESTYAGLREDLRQQNLSSLERMLNETFELVYENDSYSRIELDERYRLTVYQNDGEPLAPEQLSGGERALFNLSLRCAIYRLLAEGIEGTAPMPPLILDEPTVFLDDSHVSQLVELIDAMRELGVEQILVVSHDEELVAAADRLLHVRKDPTTNRSTVEAAPPRRRLAEATD